MPHESLKSLHTATIDAREGYEEAVKDAESTQLAAFFRSMNILHAAHHAELHQALLEAGETPEDDGSFMSKVHTSVISVRAAITGLAGAMSSFASGERRIVKAYDAAIDAAVSPNLADMLRRQKDELQTRISEMNAMTEHA